MTRTLVLYINHSVDIDPLTMSETMKITLESHLANWLATHGLQGWHITGIFQDGE